MADQKIRDRIRRLMEMTAARGCTEAEALSAAAKAAELMRQHGLSEQDLVMDVQASKAKAGGRSERSRLWPTIALCTNTDHVVITRRNGDLDVEFVGRAPGPEIAVYLRTVCERAIDREIASFKEGKFYRRRRSLATKRAAVRDFTIAMTLRLQLRLVELFRDTIDPIAGQEARRALAERHPSMETISRPDRDERFWEASMAGSRAGNNVPLAHGVGGGADRLMIGGRS